MSDEKYIFSRYSIYLMAHPDATREEFLADTGAAIKDWYNTKARVAGVTLRDKGVRLPHSKSIVWLMTHPEATKAEYVSAGYNPDSFIQNCNRAIDLLAHCNAARTLIDPLVRTVNARERVSSKHKTASLLRGPMIQKSLDLQKPKLSLADYWLSDLSEQSKPNPEMTPDVKISADTKVDFKPSVRMEDVKPLPLPKPYKPFMDSSDIELRVKKAVDEMMTEMREQQQKAETYRARITALNAENFKLRAEIAELTEMINGNAV
jgi:hypothetical protein